MIKGYAILFILFSIEVCSCSGHKEKIACDKFRRGIFSIKKNIKWNDITITRNDSLQIEIAAKSAEINYYKVIWTGDCSYDLTFIRKTGADDFVIDTTERPVLKVTILEANEKYYTFEASMGRGTSIYKDTMWVVDKIGGFKAIGDAFKSKQ